MKILLILAMVNFCVRVFSGVIGFFSGTFIEILSFLLTIVIIVASLILARKRSANNIITEKDKVMSLGILLIAGITLLFAGSLKNKFNHYYFVKQYLSDMNVEYKTLKYKDEKIKKDTTRCDGYFDVSLKDDSDIVFQIGYCDVGTMWTNYEVISNFMYYYVDYYYQKYKENHDVTFTIERNNESTFSADDVVIRLASDEQKKEVYDFVTYYRNQVGLHFKYQLFVRADNDSCYVSSWNTIEDSCPLLLHNSINL